MGWALVFIGLLFAPIVWGLTKGRGVRDVTEDHDGATGYGAQIKNALQGPPGGTGVGGGSGGAGN
jgi:hypothetical protein